MFHFKRGSERSSHVQFAFVRHFQKLTGAISLGLGGMMLSGAILSFSPAQADDVRAKELFEQGLSQFQNRKSDGLVEIEQAITSLSSAAEEAQDSLLKYDVLVLLSRAYYFKGTHTSALDVKKATHLRGKEIGDSAEKLHPEFAEAPYFAGINLARWGEANGVAASVGEIPRLRKYMNRAKGIAEDGVKRKTRDGREGVEVDGYGPSRTLGRLEHKLGSLGSLTTALKELRQAADLAPELALNVVYLADTLIKKGNAAQKAEGTALLNELLANDPETYNEERKVETAEEFALGRLVLAGKDI